MKTTTNPTGLDLNNPKHFDVILAQAGVKMGTFDEGFLARTAECFTGSGDRDLDAMANMAAAELTLASLVECGAFDARATLGG